MQNYELEARKKQEEREAAAYQTQRDPFAYGQQVARRRYSEIMSGLQERQRSIASSYEDLYQAAKEQGVRQRAAGGPSLSGGMQAQYSDLISAGEMQQLGQIGRSREQAIRELELQKQSAFANAELEGQQATQAQLQLQQNRLDIISQKNQILANAELTNEQKAESLEAIGYVDQAAELRATPTEEGGEVIPKWLGFAGAGSTALFATAKAFGAKKALTATAGVLAKAGPVGWGILAVGAAILTVDKLLEWVAPEANITGAGKGEGLINLGPLMKQFGLA